MGSGAFFTKEEKQGTQAKSSEVVLIKTAQSDKCDRHLADIFVDEECVNQKLIERGLAAIVGE